MDEYTKETVRTLLERHPRGYVDEVTGFVVTNTTSAPRRPPGGSACRPTPKNC